MRWLVVFSWGLVSGGKFPGDGYGYTYTYIWTTTTRPRGDTRVVRLATLDYVVATFSLFSRHGHRQAQVVLGGGCRNCRLELCNVTERNVRVAPDVGGLGGQKKHFRFGIGASTVLKTAGVRRLADFRFTPETFQHLALLDPGLHAAGDDGHTTTSTNTATPGYLRSDKQIRL